MEPLFFQSHLELDPEGGNVDQNDKKFELSRRGEGVANKSRGKETRRSSNVLHYKNCRRNQLQK